VFAAKTGDLPIDFCGLPTLPNRQIGNARVPLTNCFHVILPRSFTGVKPASPTLPVSAAGDAPRASVL